MQVGLNPTPVGHLRLTKKPFVSLKHQGRSRPAFVKIDGHNEKMRMNRLIIIGVTVYFCLSSLIGLSQIPWEEYDYLEIRLTHSHSFGGHKLVRLVHFSKDSCFYEYYESPKADLIEWWKNDPENRDTIGCSSFNKASELFDSIESREILLHNDDIIILDGFMISLEMTNGNSSAIYKIHTPRKKDEHIEDFKICANLLLNLVGENWIKWIK